MPLGRRVEPFDHQDWLFELKYDGFPTLAIVEPGRTQLISRSGHPFTSFSALADSIFAAFPGTRVVLDGEICSLDRRGRPQFRNLLFRRGNVPCFLAFDVLMCDGKDWRLERLADRKQELRRLLNRVSADLRLCYVDYVDGIGSELFRHACRLDLEGIVAKHKHAPYVTDREQTTWFKIRNPRYSQWKGREELFERDRSREPVPGWHSCTLACAGRGQEFAMG